jgi:hypothetical protein
LLRVIEEERKKLNPDSAESQVEGIMLKQLRE